MTRSAPARRHRAGRLASVLLTTVLVTVGGCGAPGDVTAEPSAAATPGTASPDPPARDTGAAGRFQDPAPRTTTSSAAQGLVPTRVSIPSIDTESDLEHLGLGADGRIQPPVDWQRAGWYDGGVVPGDVGPAVIAGHVDAPTGPAVFLDLDRLEAGDEVVVTLSDGSTRTFTVDRALHVAKAEFPTSEVYRTTPTPQLRLITCAGAWDPTTGHYDDNLVVFASQSDAA